MYHYCLDPHRHKCELEVHKIIHLKNIPNWLLDVFVDAKKEIKSHISAASVP